MLSIFNEIKIRYDKVFSGVSSRILGMGIKDEQLCALILRKAVAQIGQ